MNDRIERYYALSRKEIGTILPDRIGSVLEIGCGAGATMAWLRTIRPVDYAVGAEIVPQMAERARSVFDEVIVGDIEAQLLSPDRKFDTVIALDVLEHLTDPWAMVRKLSLLLKDDGVFLASLPHVGNWSVIFPLFFRGRWDYQDEGLLDRTHLRFFDEPGARALFEGAQFRIEKLDYVKNCPGRTPAQRWIAQKYLSPFLPHHWFNFQFLIRARKGG
jgi:SAM-dependent methyltransferase